MLLFWWDEAKAIMLEGWRSLVNPHPQVDDIWLLDNIGQIRVIEICAPLYDFQNDYLVRFKPYQSNGAQTGFPIESTGYEFRVSGRKIGHFYGRNNVS